MAKCEHCAVLKHADFRVLHHALQPRTALIQASHNVECVIREETLVIEAIGQ